MATAPSQFAAFCTSCITSLINNAVRLPRENDLDFECTEFWGRHGLLEGTKAVYAAHIELLKHARRYALQRPHNQDVLDEVRSVAAEIARPAFEFAGALPALLDDRRSFEDWSQQRRLLREFVFRHAEILIALDGKVSSAAGAALKGGGDALRTALAGLSTLTAVFVCYSGQNKDVVKKVLAKIRSPLEKRFVNIWFDEKNLKDSDWQKQLRRNLELIDCAVVMSSASLHVTDFVREIELPKIHKKFKAKELECLHVTLTRCMQECAEEAPECAIYRRYIRHYLRYPREEVLLDENHSLIDDRADRCGSELVQDIMRLAASCANAGNGMHSLLNWYETYYKDCSQ
jgi:hypothetical protein